MKRMTQFVFAAWILTAAVPDVFSQEERPRDDRPQRVEQPERDEAPPRDERRRPRENFLGVVTAPVAEPLAAHLAEILDPGQGLMVARVFPDSAAEKAGLQRFDVLAAYGDQKLMTPDQLVRLLAADEPGATVALGVVRHAQLQTIEVTLEEPPAPLRPRLPRLGFDFRLPDRPALDARSISVMTPDGRTFRVAARYLDERGRPRQQRLEGTADEIRERLDALPDDVMPEDVRDEIRRSLERTIERMDDDRRPDDRPRLGDPAEDVEARARPGALPTDRAA